MASPRLAPRDATPLRAPRQWSTAPATSAAGTGKHLWPAKQSSSHHGGEPVMPNHSHKLTHYGMRRLAAPGQVCYFPSAAKQRTPPRSA